MENTQISHSDGVHFEILWEKNENKTSCLIGIFEKKRDEKQVFSWSGLSGVNLL